MSGRLGEGGATRLLAKRGHTTVKYDPVFTLQRRQPIQRTSTFYFRLFGRGHAHARIDIEYADVTTAQRAPERPVRRHALRVK